MIDKKSSARLFALASLASLAALVVLASSQHRVRLIVGAFDVVDSMARLTPGEPVTYMAAHQDADSLGFGDIIAELIAFERLHPLVPGDAMPALDQPDTCLHLLEEGKRIHCYNADIGVCSMLAKQKVQARLWDLTGPSELGGDGHNLLEVFDAQSKTWRALDPYYHCYFFLASMSGDSTPINVPVLRLALLENPSAIRMVQYVHLSDDRPDSVILRELRFLAPCATLHANNDFRARYANRYRCLMPFAPLIDKLPLRASRGVRMLMLGSDDTHYIIEDIHSPHYPILLMKWLFWSLFVLFGFFFLLTIISFFQRRRSNPNAKS